MEQIATFFAMGGYAAYVWPAFAIAAVGLVALLTVSLRGLRARRAELETLQGGRREAAEPGVVARNPCPYLKAEVELTDERERHIAERHPDLLPEHRERIVTTLADPDQVRRSAQLSSARLFSRWYDDLPGGKHVVVVVVGEPSPGGRHWIITAYIATKLVEGDAEWKRS